MTRVAGKAGNQMGPRRGILVTGDAEISGIETQETGLIGGMGVVAGSAASRGCRPVHVFLLVPVILVAGGADLLVRLTDPQLTSG